VNRGQAGPLTRQSKPSKLVIAQRQIPVSPFNIGTRALENLRELSGLLVEVPLRLGTPLAQGPTRLEQGRAKTTSKFPKRLATADGPSWGHAIEIIGWDERRVHREGGGLRQVQRMNLLSHITGDKLNGCLYFGHHPFSFVDPTETALAEVFVLGDGAHRLNVSADI
jgi:hypothetical protein